MDAVAAGEPPLHERRFVVTGRVQGVGFRWFVREQARALGVRGWVRNADDGTVIVEAAASEPILARFGSALAQGTPVARVSDVRAEARAGGAPLPEEFVIVR